MKTSTFCAVALLSTFDLLPQAASAESLGVVAVAEPPGPTAELAELTHQLRLVAAERTTGVVDANELRERMTGQTSSATLAELDRAYAGALSTYQNGDFEGAVRTLRTAIEDLERLPAGPEAFSQWTRAMLRLARAEQTLGRGGEASEVLGRLVRANPAVKADANQYPPSFVKQVEEVKAQVAKLVKRKLIISTTSKGAKVFVEEREVGAAPITLELPPGRYRVSGAHGNLHVPAVTVDLTEEGQSINLNFALAESFRPGFGPGLALVDADRARNLVAAGSWLRLDKLLAARLVNESGAEYLAAALFDVRRGMLLREGRVRLTNKIAPAGSLTALASFLITGQTSNLVAQTQFAPTPTNGASAAKTKETSSLNVKAARETKPDLGSSTPASPAAAGRSKVMGWTALGAGALGVALGGFAIYEGTSARSSYDKASSLLKSAAQVDDTVAHQYNQYVSDGDSARKVAFVSGGAAVGCLAVSGVLGYLSYRQTGEIGPFRF